MRTALKTPEGNFLLITQQYSVGLYIAIYRADEEFNTVGTPTQQTSPKTEKDYHGAIRKIAKKRGEFVEEHSIG